MRVLKVLGIVVAVVLVSAVGAFFYVKSVAQGKLDKQYDVKVEAIPIPFPLSKAEIDAIAKRKGKANPEAALAGTTLEPTALRRAAAFAAQGAQGRGHNDFKIELMQRAIVRAVETVGGRA